MLDKKEVEKLAELARIKMSDEELGKIHGDLERILEYVSEIKSAPTDGLPEIAIPEHRNIFREDGEPHESGYFSEKLLRNVPERKDDYVRVKKIL